MKQLAYVAATVVLTACTAALGNDTMATLGAGGLVFVQSPDVRMLSEDLYVSPDEVRVRYEFRNDGQADASTLVAFPLPDITGSPDFMVDVPSEDAANVFGFETKYNGEAVEAELHQYVFAENIEYTDFLTDLGVPLLPFADATLAAVNALSEADQQELFHRGLVIPMESYSSENGKAEIVSTEWQPVWTLKSTYSWEAHFPVGETVVVEHRYKPSVGGTVAVTFMSEDTEDNHPLADAQSKYCVDENLFAAVQRSQASPDEAWSAPYLEQWIQYIWSTGANWRGPIDKFRLVVDKGDPKNLVSFCWDGEIKKIAPTQFEATATDFFPPIDREFEIMLLRYNEPVPEATN